MKKAGPKNKAMKKAILVHPESRREMRIDATVFKNIRAAIRQSLRGSTGKTFTLLTEDVANTLKKRVSSFKGSVSWYTISVLRDMQTNGIVETVMENRKKLYRLKK
jgi:quinolinate synthase